MALVTHCENCGKECEVIEEDDGGYEEIWGAKIWCSAFTTKSDCCKENYEEIEDGY